MQFVKKKHSGSYFRRLTRLKKLFWIYFLLLIFEGALRKWVAPQLSAPLLIVRDPIAVCIIWEAYRSKKWPYRWSSVIALVTVLLVGLFVLQSITGDSPLVVELYGLRSYLLPFPVMFIMGENLNEEDLRKVGACTLWLLLPLTLLEVAQYLSPSNSFLNKGAYEGAAQIGYIGGHARASGTFSFVIGVTHYATLAAAFIFYGMVKEGFSKKWLLWAGALALVVSVPTTGSRTLVFQLAAVVGAVGISAMMGLAQFGKALRIILLVIIVASLATFLPVFSDAMGNLSKRFSESTAQEGGSLEQSLFNRTLEPAIKALERGASSSNWMGIGLGRGAAAMQALLSGTTEFVAGEDEFSREIIEMGPICGIVFGLFKVILVIIVFRQALFRARDQQPFALLLFPLAASTLFFGVPEQPTVQGFMVVGTALCIAAGRTSERAIEQMSLMPHRQQLFYQSRMQHR